MVCNLVSVYSDCPQLGIDTIKTNYRTLHYWSRDMLDFDFLEKDLGIASPPCFLYDFSRKIFLMLNSITD